jgi:hypothetical protein
VSGTRVFCYPYTLGGRPGRRPWLATCICGWHDTYAERHEAHAAAGAHRCPEDGPVRL